MASPNPKDQIKYTSIRNVLVSGPAGVDEQTPSPVDMEPTPEEQSHSVVAEYQYLETCHICEGEEILMALPCGHSLCHDCMTRGCSAVRYERDWPMRCDVECSVPESVAIQALPQEQARILKKKIQELTTPPNQRCYCAKRDCSAYLASARPSEENQQAHDNMQKEGYRQCSNRRRMIKRNGGCSHMTCVCGHEWCIHCGGLISDCNGCGHLEPDIVGVREEGQWVHDNDAAIPIDLADDEELQQRFQMSILRNAIFQMSFSQRPASADNSTMNFNQMVRAQGYEGPLIWYGPDGNPVFVQSDEDFPSGRDLAFSDVMLSRVFDTAELVPDAEEQPEEDV
ncbi:hypothetical protein E4T47_03716 [Aureobasidium subglaciale]|nr:hypothetical protein E4T47_03716 [Aureobasidium subglaciale]